MAALAAGALISTRALLSVAVGLLVAYAYSAPPLHVSYRTYLAPLLLAVGYVATPYVLGVVVQERSLFAGDHGFLGALAALFVARIVLKDFRDRRGHAMHGGRRSCWPTARM